MNAKRVWTRDQLLVALRLYMRTPFGRLHGKNPEIVLLANRIGRTANALAMKASNFASIDPNLQRKGLLNSSQADKEIWAEFESNATQLANDAEEAYMRFEQNNFANKNDDPMKFPVGPTEVERMQKVRRVQSFFREAVLVSYECRCAISGIKSQDLLVASHIIPWSVSESLRADPRNGICLNSLFDRAFDRGWLTLDENFRIVVHQSLIQDARNAIFPCSLLDIHGMPMRKPIRFQPLAQSLAYHRNNIFSKNS
jgi:putative restriction endonuclease